MTSSIKKILVFVVTTLVLVAGTAATQAADTKIDLKALLARQTPILLEFGRGWCIPCKYMKPILADMAKAYAGRAIVMTVDMDANRDLVRSFNIRAMPTQVFLTADGKVFFRNEGILEREQIAQVFGQMGVPNPSQGVTAGPDTRPAQ